jgi:hypothetical protein
MALDPRDLLRRPAPEATPTAPLAGTREQRVQRLQIGLIGVGGLLLVLGLADAISSRAQLTEDNAVPEAAPTVAPGEANAPRDPLVDAGVQPDLPASPTPTPGASPETGDVPAPVSNNAPLQ